MEIKEKKIGFIGQGYIGGNLADNLEERGFKNLVRYSLEKEYVGNKEKIKDCETVFVAVPTPTTSKGFDSSIVEEAVSLCADNSVVVIKSTVPCYVLEDLSEKFDTKIIIHVPEFLDVNTAKHDTDCPKKNIFGIHHVSAAIELAYLISCVSELTEILPKAPYNGTMGYRESSLVKYFHNTFFYIKNVTFNMFYDMAIKNDCNWDVLLEGVLAEPRINPIHTHPINKGGRGAGGECLIKDFVVFKDLYLRCFGENEDGSRLLELIEKKNVENLRGSGKDSKLLEGVYGKSKFKEEEI